MIGALVMRDWGGGQFLVGTVENCENPSSSMNDCHDIPWNKFLYENPRNDQFKEETLYLGLVGTGRQYGACKCGESNEEEPEVKEGLHAQQF